jgi:ATPase subunit of ABC transporter with duplicated ATPase domains
MTSLYEFTGPVRGDESADQIAIRAIRAMSQQKRKDILFLLVVEWVREVQREEARRIERQSAYEYKRGQRRENRQWRKRIDDLRENHPDEYRRRYTFAGVTEQIEEMRRDIKLEVTAELLASSFALGDGRVVTWGEATAEDHRQRAKLLGQNVIGNLTTMLLHEQAAEMIEAAGAPTLGQMPQAVAA